MKKFGFLALALTLSVYSLGCGKPAATPTTPTTPAADAPAAEGDKPAEGEAPAADAGHGEAGHEHAEGEAPAGEAKP